VATSATGVQAMTDSIKVWVAIDPSGLVRTRTVRVERVMTQAAAVKYHGDGASTWEIMEKLHGWTTRPYTLQKDKSHD
jgi:hypothetical protein